jgi:hypothetical protein
MDDDPSRVPVHELTFAEVDARSDLQTDRTNGLDRAGSDAHGRSRLVEDREQTVAGDIDLTAGAILQQLPEESELATEEYLQASIAQLCSDARRPDGVHEDHGLQSSTRIAARHLPSLLLP